MTPIQKTQALVVGAVANKGSFKDDKTGDNVDFDNIKFYVQMPLTKGKGFATAEFKIDNRSHDFEKIFGGVELPAVFEISSIDTVNGKGKTTKQITDVVVIKPVKGLSNEK